MYPPVTSKPKVSRESNFAISTLFESLLIFSAKSPFEVTSPFSRFVTPFNSAFADESLSANGRFQRTFGKLRASVRANLNYSKFNQFVQNSRTVNESFSQTYRAQLRTNFRTAPNVDLSYRYSIQDNNLGANSTKFFT